MRSNSENGTERTTTLEADSVEGIPENDNNGVSSSNEAVSSQTPPLHHDHEPIQALLEQHTSGDWFEQLQHKIYCREEEEAILLRAYLSRMNPATKSTPGEFCLISGSSGLGKSRLARTLQEAADEDGGYFLVTKFDQVRQAKPTRVFADAFSGFTQSVLDKGETVVQAMMTSILDALGDEIGILTSAIPDIVQIVGEPTIEPVQMTYQLSERFVFALHELIRVVCTRDSPVVIFFDDLQWAHPGSLRLIKFFISCNQNENLFIMGSCETDVTGPKSAFANFVRDLENTNRTQVFMIEVDQKPVKVIKEILVDSFPMSNGNRDHLAEIVIRQTKGIPLYVLEFIRWLYDEELLQYDKARKCWNLHDKENGIVDDSLQQLDDFWVDRLKRLPSNVQEVIICAACFGYEIDESILKLVVSGDTLMERLDEATRKDVLVYHRETGYSFRHEGLQMASLKLIPNEEEAAFHLNLGRELLKRIPKEERWQHMYMILGLIRKGEMLVQDPAEKRRISSLCLNAGRAAASGSTFGVAAEYLNFGIELLDDNSWEVDYDLTYDLYITSAEVHMTISNYDRVELLVQAILDHGRDIYAKIPACITLIYMKGITGQQHAAVDEGILVLKQLGETFRHQNLRPSFSHELREVSKLLHSKSNEDIKKMSMLQDKKKLASMQILKIMLLNAVMCRPSFAPFVHLKAMEITMKHGLSPLSSIAFAGYGALCATRGNFDEAERFASLSLELLEQFGSKEYIPRVYACVYGYIHVWRHPLEETLEPLKLGHHIGSLTGDIEFACLNANLYFSSHYFSGAHLSVVSKEVKDMINLMSARQQDSMLMIIRPLHVLAQNLMGLTKDPLNLTAEISALDAAPELQNFTSQVVLGLQLMMLRYLFGAYAGAMNAIPGVEAVLKLHPSMKQIFSIFFIVLTRLTMARKSRGCRRLQLIWKAQRTARKFDEWEKVPKQNYLPMKLLLDAEFASIKGNKKLAHEKYNASADRASKSGYPMVEAMAHEHAGRHFFRIGDTTMATISFKKAFSCYHQWGARAKVQHLHNEVKLLCEASGVPMPALELANTKIVN